MYRNHRPRDVHLWTSRTRGAASVRLARQEVPVALAADKQRRIGPIRRRTRLRRAGSDQVRYRRYRRRREEDGVAIFLVIVLVVLRSAPSGTRDEEEASAVGRPGGSQRFDKLFADRRDLVRNDQILAQRGSVPQVRG